MKLRIKKLISANIKKRGRAINTIRHKAKRIKPIERSKVRCVKPIKAKARVKTTISTNKTITQCYMSCTMRKKFSSFYERHRLKPYYDSMLPSVFGGVYCRDDINAILRHKSLAVVVWRGSDILKFNKRSISILNKPNIKHVAISSFILADLQRLGIKCKLIPLVGVDVGGVNAKPLGNELYAYAPRSRLKFSTLYNADLVDQLSKMIPYKINIADSANVYSKEELRDVYGRCFLGLRLTTHDGIANQVIEMGLMGRRCIHNGEHPNAIHWSNLENIIDIINSESVKIGKVDESIALNVAKYIDVGSEWLNVGYW